MKKTLLMLSLIAWNSIAYAKSDEIKADFSTIDYSATPNAEQFPQASVVTLLEEGKITFSKKGFYFTRHVIKKILNERGQNYANNEIFYNKGYSDIEVLKARTITADGKVIELDKNQFYDVTDFPDFVLYADYKAKRFTFPAVQPGAIIEYVYRQHLSGYNIPSWYFQRENPVLFSRFVLEVPRNIRYKILKRRGNIDLIIKEDVDNKAGYLTATYSAANIPALNDEPYMPAWQDIVPSIRFTPVVVSFYWTSFLLEGNSWADIGKWYTRVIKDRMEPESELEEQAQSLIAGNLTEQQKAKAICEFVRNNFRYVSIDIGNGGADPHDVNKILRNRYGDCKDLSVLTVALLKEAGIEAWVGLVRTADNGVVEKTFCSASVFNHAIVCLPAKIITDSLLQRQISKGEPDSSRVNDCLVFDPTVRWCPFGYLPWTDMGVEVLVINGDSSAFVSTPLGESKDNAFYAHEQVVNDGREERHDMAITCNGAEAMEYRYLYNSISQEKRREDIERIVMNLYPAATFDSFSIANLQEPDSLLRIKIAFNVGIEHDYNKGPLIKYLTVIDDFGKKNPFTKDKREQPISFNYPQGGYYSYYYILTDPTLYIKPISDSLVTDWTPIGKYKEVWSGSADRILCKRVMELQTVWNKKSSYYVIKDLFNNKFAFQKKMILIDKKNPKPGPVKKTRKQNTTI